MKTVKLLGGAALFTVLALAACQKSKDSTQASSSVESINARPPRQMGSCEPNAYVVTLVSANTPTANGYEWIWTVQNPNPGNGLNGTTQNLSHWGFPINACVPANTITGAGYSADGVNWTNFTPIVQPDPSQACMTAPVLKFDFGTNGGNLSYYRIYTNTQYEVNADASAYYKSGSNTGCCVFSFDGMYCGGEDGVIR